MREKENIIPDDIGKEPISIKKIIRQLIKKIRKDKDIRDNLKK